MGIISVSLPNDGDTIDVSDYNTPITTIVNEINGNLDNNNIAAAAAIAGSKLANASVTPTKWTNPYCFKAYNSSTTALPDATITQVLFATEVYDYSNIFSGSTCTPTISGIYHFDFNFTIDGGIATPVDAWAQIYINGVVVMSGPRFIPAGTDGAVLVSGDLLVASGEGVTAHAYQNSAGAETTKTGVTNTWFSGHLVHPT